jgi:hypothetical protein
MMGYKIQTNKKTKPKQNIEFMEMKDRRRRPEGMNERQSKFITGT